MALPELGQDKGYVSESVFTFIFISFLLVGGYFASLHMIIYCIVHTYLIINDVCFVMTLSSYILNKLARNLVV
jgi:hypothetical protein